MKSSVRLLLLAAVALALSGCVRVDIGGSHQPTLGRQIMDLYQARQSGAISAKQFKRLQVKVVEGAAR